MTNSERDKKVWDEIIKYYNKLNLDAKRNQSQHIDYYCLPELKKVKNKATLKKIDRDEKQRLFARFLKSYLSSTWHWIQKGHGETTVGDEVNTWLAEKNVIAKFENYKKDSQDSDAFCDFGKCVQEIVNKLELNEYDFSEKQIDNFKAFSKTIGDKFGDGKRLVSQAEKIIYENAPEPYATILKMSKVIEGFGIALACDFLREAHLCNIAKPDVHICHVFSVIDGISYSMDLPLVKRVSEFSANVCPENEKDFCNTGAYNVDKIIWLICSESNSIKTTFLNNLKLVSKTGKSKMKTDSQTDIDVAAVRHQTDDSCTEVELNRSIIEQVLKKFNIPGKITNYTVGPHIIRFEITLPAGVKVRVIEKIEDAIAAEFTENIRILAPIPGSSKVGLEVPRVNRKTISFRSIIETKAWQDSNDNLPVVIGKDVAGKTVIIDLTKAPHLFIAGTAGNGNTECLNTLLASLLLKFSHNELKLLLIDPQSAEFSPYRRVPHLLMPPVNDPDKALSALNQIADEIDQRYKIMAEAGVKNITGFNSNIDNVKNAMPYIVVVINELTNLSVNKNDMELAIARIAQKGRAAGVHIVVSTQCILPDVVSGVLKANFQSRICFKVSTEQESLRVLDAKGAETLLGNGDMLLQYPYCTGFKRIQGAVLSDNKKAEIMDLVCNELQKKQVLRGFVTGIRRKSGKTERRN